MSTKLRVGMAILVVLCSAVIGYLLGSSSAATQTEWRQARATAQRQAFSTAFEASFQDARREGREAGLVKGKAKGKDSGTADGETAGQINAEEELAAIEAERAAELIYDPQLPNGDPGYILPEEDRSIACIGVSAVTGECVGD